MQFKIESQSITIIKRLQEMFPQMNLQDIAQLTIIETEDQDTVEAEKTSEETVNKISITIPNLLKAVNIMKTKLNDTNFNKFLTGEGLTEELLLRQLKVLYDEIEMEISLIPENQ